MVRALRPSWRHGDAVAALHIVLHHYCREHGLGHVKIAPQDVEFDQRNMVEPDLWARPPREPSARRSRAPTGQAVYPAMPSCRNIVAMSKYCRCDRAFSPAT